MPEQFPDQPLYTPGEMDGQDFRVHFITDNELGALSTDHFRETGQNYTEWAESDPQGAYNALRTYLTAARYRGNEGAAADSGLQERFDAPTTVSVRAYRPTLRQRFTGAPPNVDQSREITRLTLAQNHDDKSDK